MSRPVGCQFSEPQLRLYFVQSLAEIVVEVAIVGVVLAEVDKQLRSGVAVDNLPRLALNLDGIRSVGLGSQVLDATLRDFCQAAQVYHIDADEHKRQLEEVEVLLLPFLGALVLEDAAQRVDVEVTFACGFRLDLEA